MVCKVNIVILNVVPVFKNMQDEHIILGTYLIPRGGEGQ